MFGRLLLAVPRRAATFWAENNSIRLVGNPRRLFQMGSPVKNVNKELCSMLNREKFSFFLIMRLIYISFIYVLLQSLPSMNQR